MAESIRALLSLFSFSPGLKRFINKKNGFRFSFHKPFADLSNKKQTGSILYSTESQAQIDVLLRYCTFLMVE